MSTFYCGSNHREWSKQKLKDFGDYAECVTYCNQREDYADSLRGDWYYGDDDNLTIYYGSFGNDHSPGSSHNTYAEVFETKQEYHEKLKEWEACEEYLEEEESDIEVQELGGEG